MDRNRRIEEKQSLKHNEPAAQKYSNINEARESSFFVSLFSILRSSASTDNCLYIINIT